MARLDINRAGEMEVFVRVVELGGFSRAAVAVNMTPSAVSKLMARLERRLGARLLNRSTRQLQMTPEGCAFYERASQILSDIEEAERAAGDGEKPAGRVRINTSASYATHILAPILPRFLALHSDITLDIVQTDQVVDLLAERTDVAVRAGPLKSSSHVARKLGETRMIIVGAPEYLERCRVPQTVAELEGHNRLALGYTRSNDGWSSQDGGKTIVIPAAGRVQVSDGEGLRRLALAGVGLARLAAFTVRQDIARGRLISVLDHLDTGETEMFHAVYVGQRAQLPSRIRALLDFLGEYGRVK
ncbi:LysR family transcriptional regulator [Agrobacterium tumefaciens]|uniref:LysR family transcriptional regulator n=1 Tax=Agrobacterium tumefaciens TaxID=358 RepID=UPI00384C7752